MTENSKDPDALAEWAKLDKAVSEPFKKKCAERLLNPHLPALKLSGQINRYKIKLKSIGYRLASNVVESQLIVTFVAVGKRERNVVCKAAASR